MIDIARKEFPDISTSISVTANSDGGIRVEGYDVGEGVEKWFGRDDHEYWVDVPASEIRQLVLLLLAEKYKGNVDAVAEFRAYCEAKGIAHKFMTWS